jgi:peroxiredoxin
MSVRSDLVPGTLFPDFELPDYTDTARRLSTLQGDDPMVLTLNRGIYCPKDRQQLQALVPFHAQMRVGFSRLVTITTDSLIGINDLRLGVGADWPFLYDTERVVQRDLDIQEYTDARNDPMIPHTVVLEPGLKVFKIYNGYWFWGRPSTAELHADLRDITRRIRPDWDIQAPGMRERWEARERESFYPYGRPWRDVFARMAGAVDQFDRGGDR